MALRIQKILMIALVMCAAIVTSAPAWAKDGAAVAKADIDKVEAYMQSLKTAQARFVQTTHTGEQLVGTFYLNRPGKLRFEYDPPVTNFVVADGAFIYFYDGLLEEQTNAPIGTTLADFFLRKEFTLGGDLIVKEAKRDGGFLQVQVVQKDDPEGGSLTFAFDENPLELKKWRVVDAQGMITEVELFYLKKDVKLDSKLFYYVDPGKGKKKYNE